MNPSIPRVFGLRSYPDDLFSIPETTKARRTIPVYIATNARSKRPLILTWKPFCTTTLKQLLSEIVKVDLDDYWRGVVTNPKNNPKDTQ
jgi:hypothetical protein